ncbi:MAG: tetratricopeptide repeat protein [Bacteroidia bacterium]
MKYTKSIFFIILVLINTGLIAQNEAYERLKTISEETNLEIRFNAISKLIEEYPEYALAYHEKGQAYYKAKQFDSAYVYFQKALSFPSPKPAYHYAMANCLRQTGKEEQALEQFQLALDIDPKYYPVTLELTQYYLKNQQYSELKQAIETLLEWEEEMAVVYFMRANLKMQTADLAGMQADMKKVVALAPKQMEVYDRLAVWTEEQGMLNYPEERLEWKTMNIQLAQGASMLTGMTEKALEKVEERYTESESLKEKFGPYNESLSGEKASIQEINRLTNTGLDQFRAGELKKALAEFEKVLQYYPQHKEALKYQKEIKALLE